jgi:hypothetical protein
MRTINKGLYFRITILMKAMKKPSNNALCLDLINENPFTTTVSQPEQR